MRIPQVLLRELVDAAKASTPTATEVDDEGATYLILRLQDMTIYFTKNRSVKFHSMNFYMLNRSFIINNERDLYLFFTDKAGMPFNLAVDDRKLELLILDWMKWRLEAMRLLQT